jgi:hypothetical protein
MAAVVTGSKTITLNAYPGLTASTLTTIMATPVEQLTVAQLGQLKDAISRIPGGGNPSATIGSLLK